MLTFPMEWREGPGTAKQSLLLAEILSFQLLNVKFL